MALGVSLLGHIWAWFHMQGQFKYEWMRQWWVIGLTGIPVSYMFFYSTRWYYEYFNNYWYVRPIGFSIATITFGALAWLVLDEIPDTKTIISLFLSVIIVILQLSK